MSNDPLRFAAFCAYLVAWLVFALGALVNAIPRMGKQAGVPLRIHASVVIGTILQFASALTITLSMGDGPLRPSPVALACVTVLAPSAAALFAWAILSTSRQTGVDKLMTSGAYACVRNPIYLAFLAMLAATGLLVSRPLILGLAILLYLAGSEMRIAAEERDLADRFPTEYPLYRARTCWRYLPGLR